MRTSSLNLLQNPTVVVLAAGHGDNDPGAVNLPHKERDQAIIITDRVAEILKRNGVEVEIVPHEYGLSGSISWINGRFVFGDAWVLELHRDSANGLT
ncbi:hypothetical protein C7B61_00910, partial [filamentous cyanobacterium CCP1]